MKRLELRFDELIIMPERHYLETRFADGRIAPATRELNATENRTTALDLGYTDSADGVWRSLICHELLHSLLSDWLWDQASQVLLHMAGAKHTPHHERIFEEAVVLAFELHLNTGAITRALQPYSRPKLDLWRSSARQWIARATEAA
jgi:hypothetical protein